MGEGDQRVVILEIERFHDGVGKSGVRRCPRRTGVGALEDTQLGADVKLVRIARPHGNPVSRNVRNAGRGTHVVDRRPCGSTVGRSENVIEVESGNRTVGGVRIGWVYGDAAYEGRG